MLYLSLLCSAGLLVIVNAIAFWRGRRGMTAALVFGVFACCYLFCVGLPAVMLNALLLVIEGAAWWRFGTRPRWFLVSSLGATVVAYVLVGWLLVVPEVREWERLKTEYPIESVAGRLAYEDRPRPGSDTAAYDRYRLRQFEIALDETEAKTKSPLLPGGHSRARHLERLHAGTVEQFVNSPGFGFGRLPLQPTPHGLQSMEESDDGVMPPPIPQRSRPYVSPDPAPEGVTAADRGPASAHTDNATAFLNPFDFGYLRDRDHVAGFRPHQFRRQPEAPKRWQIERLELVGLLKYDEPVVYLSDYLPKMDALRDAPTRPLDAFEEQALAALRDGEDLMVQSGPDRMRMLGSLRAVERCRQCHRAERGELLGAFSYRLVRALKD